jgi:hypothetical protein
MGARSAVAQCGDDESAIYDCGEAWSFSELLEPSSRKCIWINVNAACASPCRSVSTSRATAAGPLFFWSLLRVNAMRVLHPLVSATHTRGMRPRLQESRHRR